MITLYVPNWSGHLYLQQYKDNSVSKIADKKKKEDDKFLEFESTNLVEAHDKIQREFEKEFSRDKVFSVIGDHSNTYPLVKGFRKKQDENFVMVIFDAHPDVEVPSAGASHEDYLRCLIEEEVVSPEDIYLIGVRTYSREELDYILEKGINFWSAKDTIKYKKELSRELKDITSQVYLSVDIDVVDPEEVPGTYYREWGGLRVDELKSFLEDLQGKYVAADLAEYYAEKDEEEKTFNIVEDLMDTFLNR